MSIVTQIDTSTLATSTLQSTANTRLLDIDNDINTLLKPASTLTKVTTVDTITNSVTVKADTPTNQVNAFKVDGSGVTQPVSLASIPLPTGASTSALQTTGNTSLSSLDTKATTTNTTLNDILLELRDDKLFTETVWYDKTTFAFFVRVREQNQDTGVASIIWQNPDGTTATPTVANLAQVNTIKDIEIITNKYTANTTGTGYVVGDLIEENRLIDTGTSTVTTIWFNKTQNTTIATAPTFAHLSQVENVITYGKTQFTKSNGNSSVAQLTVGSTFTGTVSDVLSHTAIIPSIRSDQPFTLTVLQYIDLAGTQLISSTSFTRLANQPFAEPIKLNGNYARITVQNTGASATTNFVVDTYFGTMEVLPSSLSNLGNLRNSVEEVGSRVITGTPATAVGNLIGLTDLAQYNEMSLQISGTFVATMRVRGTNDGVNFVSLPMQLVNDTANASITTNPAIIQASVPAVYRVPILTKFVLVEVQSYTSGTVNCVALLKALPVSPTVIQTESIHRSNGAATGSTTIVAGGTAQALNGGLLATAVSNPNRRGVEIQNTSAGDIRIAFNNTVGAGDASVSNGFRIPSGGSYVSPNNLVSIQRCTVWGATTGQTYTFIEY